jgi:hypothetical protein
MTPDARFESILENLAMLGVTRSTTFGKRGVMADGQVIASFLGDAMSFRLGEGSKELADALAFDGATLWDPRGKGHPFKDWVQVPAEQGDHWGRLTETALRRIRQKL